MHDNETLTVDDAPDPAEVAFVEERLHEHNMAATGYRDYRPLAIFVRDAAGAIAAGLTGFTWGGTLKIEVLWVREDRRGRGYGRRLVAAAEAEARAQGCRAAVLDTHSFQAPEFYPKLGYTRVGMAEDWPVGHRQLYFQKALAPGDGGGDGEGG